MSTFADETKQCQRARNSDDITEMQEDINKHVDWANKSQMNFNVEKYSVINSDQQQINSGI